MDTVATSLNSRDKSPSAGENRGYLIVLEGIDGVGKSTQARRLQERLVAEGVDARLSREPTKGVHGTKIRESAVAGRLSPREEFELFLADRQEHVNDVILPALNDGAVLIMDRYYFSSIVYQGIRGLPTKLIREANEAFAPRPDLLLVLDMAVDMALERIANRGIPVDEFETRDALIQARDMFLSFRTEPFSRVISCAGEMDEIAEEIYSSARTLVAPSPGIHN